MRDFDGVLRVWNHLGRSALFVNTGVVIGFRIISVLVTFLTTVALARVLGPTGQGIYSVSLASWAIAVGLSGLGVQWVNSVFVGRLRYSQAVLVWGSLLIVLISCVASAVCVIASLVTGFTLPGLPRNVFVVLIAAIPLGVVVDATAGIVWGRNQVRRWSAIFLFLGPFIAFGCIASLLIFHRLTVGSALASWFGGQVVTAAVGIFQVRHELFREPRLDGKTLQEMLWFGIRANVSHVLGTLNFRLDSVIVLSFLGPRLAGLYVVAEMLSQLLYLVPSSLAASLQPVFASASRDAVVMQTNQSLRLMTLVGAVGAGVLAMAAPVGLPVFGSQYSGVTTTLLILLPGAAIYSLMHVTNVYWESFARQPHVNLYLAGGSLAIDVGALLVLVPHFGLPGAAVASTGAYVISMTASLWLYTRHSHTRLSDVLLFRAADARQLRTLIASRYDETR
jgi:O-antigen/teichoic acid export membrane protein